MNVDVSELLGVLELEPVGPGRYRAANLATGGATVFGGQLMAQAVVAGLDGSAEQRAKTLHTVFARAAHSDRPIDIEVEQIHAGRSFGSCSVTMAQGDRVCARSLLLRSADEPDFVHHADPAPAVAAPGDGAGPEGAWQVRTVGDVDVDDPDAVGPPDLDVWSRFPGAPADPVTDQALLAFATDGFLIGTAMRPHPGVGQSQAHRSVATGVVSHTLTFHRPASASEWLLLSNHASFTGGGRCYGRADVFDTSGGLVASYVQDGLLRSAG